MPPPSGGKALPVDVQADAALMLPDGTVRALAAELTVGRAAGNDVVVAKAGVSRRHLRLTEDDGRWFVEDRGSLYGTFLNGVRLQPRVPYPLRHADRIVVGPETLVFFARDQLDDPDDTARFEVAELAAGRELSPFQRQVVQALCQPWLAGGGLDQLPSNEEIAARLGTPGATESVKAALRRAYAKAGLGDDSSAGKRRKLCLVARRHGWI
jgi:FHA domain-containing protein